MKDLNHCASCGFLSTRLDAFTTVNYANVPFKVCQQCANDYKNTNEMIVLWIQQAYYARATTKEQQQ